MLGEAFTLWTIRASLAFAFLAALFAIRRRTKTSEQATRSTASLIFWTFACFLFLTHVAAAFHFYHDWQHAAAFTHTADRTEELLGWRYGGGIFFNYLFGLMWLIDVLVLWRRREAAPIRASSRLANRLRSAWLVFFLFMVVNGAIVFAAGPVRWISLASLLLLGQTWMLTRRHAVK